jgi:hypothetical protein
MTKLHFLHVLSPLPHETSKHIPTMSSIGISTSMLNCRYHVVNPLTLGYSIQLLNNMEP